MTREEVVAELNTFKRLAKSESGERALDMVIKMLEAEPLTDIEQRIFLAAMGREKNVCAEVCADGDGTDLVVVCNRIERKVKNTLWK